LLANATFVENQRSRSPKSTAVRIGLNWRGGAFNSLPLVMAA